MMFAEKFMHIRTVPILLSMLLLSATLSSSQETHRLKVVFDCTCNDPVGSLFATAFRDALARSPRYIEGTAAEEKDETGKVKTLNRRVVAISLDPGEKGINTVLSIVFLVGKDIYISNRVMSFGRSNAENAARDALAGMDDAIR
jgi:hypothetical protein